MLVAGCDRGSVRAPKSAATNGADRVLVVVNKRSTSSEVVGRYYMQRRGIRQSHLVVVDVPVNDDIGPLDFRAKILAPVRAAIDSLPVRIDFIALTTGIPLRIGNGGYSVDAHLAGMRLLIPPMVGFDSAWLSTHRNPFFGSREKFASDRFNMYLVTRLDCAHVAECLALVDNCLAARASKGPFFFDATAPQIADAGFRAQNAGMLAAAAHLQRGGATVLLDTSKRFVAANVPVMGYVSWGSNDSQFDSSAYHALRFLPGALAETFVSTSGRTFGPTVGGQSRIVDLIGQGVSGVKGYVSEPYTIALAHPDILFDRYLRGFTLAESFYAASRMVLWKDIVVGDPLCAPYATTP